MPGQARRGDQYRIGQTAIVPVIHGAEFASRQGSPVSFYVLSNSSGPRHVSDAMLRRIIDTIRPLA